MCTMLQVILLARVGLILAHLQSHRRDADEISASLRWLSIEAARLRILYADRPATQDSLFSSQLLSTITSLDELKREFVCVTRKAWPTALVHALSAHRSLPSRTVSAMIYEPVRNSKETREVIAQWPFEVRIRSLLQNLSDITQIYVKV